MPTPWTQPEIDAYLCRRIPAVRTSLLYKAGLALVALALLLLQAVYVAMIVLAGYLTFRYFLTLPDLFKTVGFNQVSLLLAIAPLAAGVVVTIFLLKPFLARPPRRPDAYRVARADQPMLFAFVDRLCDRVGAPRPKAIEFDLNVNASARLNGWLSLVRSDLTLTIGIPLAAGLTLAQFSGVLAHEFGHFSQHAGLRLYFLIERIRQWFHRVAYERDGWDQWLDVTRDGHGWRAKVILILAYICVSLSRAILRGLLFCARVTSCWFSRQMEFNADRHEAELVGDQTFGETFGRIHVLAAEANGVWETLNGTLKARRLCDDFAAALRWRDGMLGAEARSLLAEKAFTGKQGRWATHPHNRDRVDQVRGVPGVIAADDDTPAEVIFTAFDEFCRKVTRHHYDATLGKSLENVTLVAAPEFERETGQSAARAAAIRGLFGALHGPARYFQLAPAGARPASIEVNVPGSDQAAEFDRLLGESALRNAGLEFMRSGGKIDAASFRVSAADMETVAREAADSRRRLTVEMASLRSLCSGQAQILATIESPIAEAYRALAEQQVAVLELRHEVMAYQILRANLKHLAAAKAANACDDRRDRMSGTSKAILSALRCIDSPLTPGWKLDAELLLFEPAGSLDPYDLAVRVVNRAETIAAELLGELCAELQRRATKAVAAPD